MTEKEIRAEWMYRKEERLGHLCEDREPTQSQLDIAITEADQWLRDWRRQEQMI